MTGYVDIYSVDGKKLKTIRVLPDVSSLGGICYIGDDNKTGNGLFAIYAPDNAPSNTKRILIARLDNDKFRIISQIYSSGYATFEGLAFDGMNLITSAKFQTLPPQTYMLFWAEMGTKLTFSQWWYAAARDIKSMHFEGQRLYFINSATSPDYVEIAEIDVINRTFHFLTYISDANNDKLTGICVMGDKFIETAYDSSTTIGYLRIVDMETNKIMKEYSFNRTKFNDITTDGKNLFIAR